MKIVHRLKIDHQNERRKKMMEAAGKKDKFVPLPYKKPQENFHGYQGKYVPEQEEKNVICISRLPEKVTEDLVKKAIGKTMHAVKKVEMVSKKLKEGKEEKLALVHVEDGHTARKITRRKRRSMKVAGKKPLL